MYVFIFFVAQILLTNQEDLVQMTRSKSTCPKWNFGQVGHGHNRVLFNQFSN